MHNTTQFCPEVLIEKCVYKRIGDILNVVCVEYNRVHRNKSRRHEICGKECYDKHQSNDEQGEGCTDVVRLFTGYP